MKARRETVEVKKMKDSMYGETTGRKRNRREGSTQPGEGGHNQKGTTNCGHLRGS